MENEIMRKLIIFITLLILGINGCKNEAKMVRKCLNTSAGISANGRLILFQHDGNGNTWMSIDTGETFTRIEK